MFIENGTTKYPKAPETCASVKREEGALREWTSTRKRIFNAQAQQGLYLAPAGRHVYRERDNQVS